eukprot:CAMPEP_0197270658 /NCGR_PEP_ID=MMETSP1432-20130617/7505_1 /TAXON_ID=44447 /ORGANISM="Pseudo-nitzschia delicatissima, Strain UNC1205" /LENGTH=214 /DNA_ID=CAMNT_0042735979 /DNA_START=69 /DNA_END=713 /DNA_ORIENTATION=-
MAIKKNNSILRGGMATTAFSFAVVVVSFVILVVLLEGSKVNALTINHVSSKTKRPTTWLIDGNNFLGQRGVHGLPRDGDKLAEKLLPISGKQGGSSTPNEVLLVFDGRKDVDTERTKSELAESFTKVQLEHGIIADDFLIEEIKEIQRTDPSRRVKLVTADKRLRQQALAIRPTVKQVVNPKNFWKKYVPRMSGQKKNPTPHMPRNSDESDEEE